METDSERRAALLGPRGLKTPGSPEWCWQTIELLKMTFAHLDDRWRDLERARKDLVDVRAWEVIPAGNPYGSEDAMLRAEIGVDGAGLEGRVATARERGIRAARGTTGDVHAAHRPVTSSFDEVKSLAARAAAHGISTAQQHRLDRLATNFPELHERVKSGALSIWGAWELTGAAKPRVSVAQTAEGFARAARKHLTPAQVAELISLLQLETVGVEA